MGNNESSTAGSRGANHKFLGSEATTAGCAPASVSATTVTTITTIATVAATVDTMSRPSAPRSAHRSLAALLLGLNDNSDVPPTFNIDPDTTVATLTLWKRSSDGTLGRLKLLKLEKGASFGTNNLELLDGSEARCDDLS